MTAPADAFAIMAFGDSITDGTASTMNGDDRWPNVLSRRLKAIHGNKVAVVNGGIGGNQIAGPAEYGPDKPFPAGPASGQRLDRDVLALSGISSLIWLEGINDFSKNGNASTDQVIAAMKDGVDRLRKKWPQLRIIGATVVDRAWQFQRRARFPGAGCQAEGAQRLHPHIRHVRRRDRFRQGDARSAIGRPQAGIRPRQHHRRPGDKLHPNRTGYLAMGQAIDLNLFKPRGANRQREGEGLAA
jgi:lysophospholipase L1-like esterase